jgi:hypothetical protein
MNVKCGLVYIRVLGGLQIGTIISGYCFPHIKFTTICNVTLKSVP